jgi:outer membrane lipoprotein-sorting protein
MMRSALEHRRGCLQTTRRAASRFFAALSALAALAAISATLAAGPARAQATAPAPITPPSAGAAAAAAKPSALEILEKMEASNNGYADQILEEKLTVIETDGAKKSYEFTLYQKGDVKRLIQFTSGEVKGMATLVEDRNSVHVYLPGFKKVRRVAAHNMSQNFAGSDLSNDDMATVSWAKGWEVALDKEDETSWWLLLTPKAGETSDYGKVVHRVDKASLCQQETHWFNKAGEEVKSMLNTDLTDFQGVKRFRTVTVSDPRTGHRTVLETKSFKCNQGLKDDLFTVRQLQWGK